MTEKGHETGFQSAGYFTKIYQAEYLQSVRLFHVLHLKSFFKSLRVGVNNIWYRGVELSLQIVLSKTHL